MVMSAPPAVALLADFGRDDAVGDAGAEQLGMFGGLLGLIVGENVRDRRAGGRQHADKNADQRGAQPDPPAFGDGLDGFNVLDLDAGRAALGKRLGGRAGIAHVGHQLAEGE